MYNRRDGLNIERGQDPRPTAHRRLGIKGWYRQRRPFNT